MGSDGPSGWDKEACFVGRQDGDVKQPAVRKLKQPAVHCSFPSQLEVDILKIYMALRRVYGPWTLLAS